MSLGKAASGAALWGGVRAMAPLGVGILPFGLVFGAAIPDSGISAAAGVSSSFIILAGASQLTMAELISTGTDWWIVVSAALFINARFSLYSAALAPSFSEFPRRWRYGLAYLLTDQAASVSLLYFEGERSEQKRRFFFLGGGLTLLGIWTVGTVVGLVSGASIPESWQVEFAVPLMFLALLIPNIAGSATAMSAVVGGAVTVAGAGLPTGLNIIVGALVGIAAGAIVQRSAQARDSGKRPGA